MSERDIEAYLIKRVKELGGQTRKVKWIGRAGAPDRIVLFEDRAIWIDREFQWLFASIEGARAWCHKRNSTQEGLR